MYVIRLRCAQQVLTCTFVIFSPYSSDILVPFIAPSAPLFLFLHLLFLIPISPSRLGLCDLVGGAGEGQRCDSSRSLFLTFASVIDVAFN